MRGRLIISIDKKGESSLVTSIGLKKEGENYTPVSVKIRIPTLPKTEQRKEISWSDFKANNLAIAVVNIY